mmetsp:Transcript_30435/g.40199  ORF Transcript_30435/g.40199 Transcript_30435/m.40199 type:complete len:370 (-) Transcript_30435:394-1503(-)
MGNTQNKIVNNNDRSLETIRSTDNVTASENVGKEEFSSAVMGNSQFEINSDDESFYVEKEVTESSDDQSLYVGKEATETDDQSASKHEAAPIENATALEIVKEKQDCSDVNDSKCIKLFELQGKFAFRKVMCTGEGEMFIESYNLGCQHEQVGETEKAISCFQKCLEYAPHSIEANFRMGEILRDSGKGEDAELYFQQVLSLDEDHYESLVSLGLIMWRGKDLTGALNYFRKASMLKLADACCWVNIGLILREMGDNIGSIEAYTKSIHMDEKYEVAYYNLGNIYYEKKRYNEAISMYMKVVQLNPNHGDAIFNVAVACEVIGENSTAIEFYNKCIEINPELRDDATNGIKRLLLKEMRKNEQKIDSLR